VANFRTTFDGCADLKHVNLVWRPEVASSENRFDDKTLSGRYDYEVIDGRVRATGVDCDHTCFFLERLHG